MLIHFEFNCLTNHNKKKVYKKKIRDLKRTCPKVSSRL